MHHIDPRLNRSLVGARIAELHAAAAPHRDRKGGGARPRRPIPRVALARVAAFLTVCLATAGAESRRMRAYLIDLLRWPLFPIVNYGTLLLAYRISGRATVDGVSAESFLWVGSMAAILWTATLWSVGYAIELERSAGTLASLLLTPASRAAVVFGYGLGSLLSFALPSLIGLGLLAWLAGARPAVQDSLAVGLAGLGLTVSTLSLGYTLAGLFVLTRRANPLANFLQSPIYLLSGMAIPIAALPGPLRWFAEAFPVSFGLDALRRTLLGGADLAAVSGALLRLSGSCLVLLIVGTLLLQRVEHVAKRGAELDTV